MMPKLSLNEAANDRVVNNCINATLPYTNIQCIEASDVLCRLKTDGTQLHAGYNRFGGTDENVTSVEFLKKMPGKRVCVVTQNLIDPMHPSRLNIFIRGDYWRPELGVLIGNSMPKLPGLGSALAWNVLFNSMDKCNFVVSHLASLPADNYYIDAIFCDCGVRLNVLSVEPLQRATFWGYNLDYDERMRSELAYPPIIVEEKKLYTCSDVTAIPEFQMIPQCACIKGDPPVHWIPLVVASDGENVYAVILDATYGQFNPEGVISGAKKMKDLFCGEYRALHAGAPKAFLVGKHASKTTPRTQVFEWFKRSSHETLSGTSVGRLGDYNFVY